ncbi:hypothetical protein [Bacillus cereus]|uniref:hypothetical protein n=3 Tax=Bacteria TaxID=2 RepID=UPI001121E367|nr:hypothetical protein [Bacillus cereus]TNO91096.1 hypothetical protein FHR08_12115 [Bacillus cereus]
MLEDLILTENAYYYRKLKNISKTKIESIFKEVSRKKEGNYVLKIVKKSMNSRPLTYSICIFKYKEKPSFINNDLLHETKFAYLLIVEYSNYVVINKKGISGLEKLLKDYIEGVEYTAISKTFLSDRTNFEKMSLHNMDISDNVVRRKSMEAINLKESISVFGVSQYIVNQVRLSNGEEKFSLSFNTSKINQLGKKVDLNYYLNWVIGICNKIDSFVDSETFMDNFSTPLSFEDYIDEITPSGLLFLTSELVNQIEEKKIDSVRYIDREIKLLTYVKRFQRTLEIEQKIISGKSYFMIPNRFDDSLRLKINKNSISIYSRILKDVILTFDNGEEMNLLAFINRYHTFMVSFNQVEIMYWNKKLFKDSKLLNNISHFLKIFKKYKRLEHIDSEKGKCPTRTKEFSNNSLFNFVEKQLTIGSDYVICDDLGNEWADYISIKSHENISFFHAKHGKKGLSASNFHEVISQAQKNLGNIFANDAELDRKKEKWNKIYSLKDYPNSQIRRLRKGTNARYAVDMYRKTLLSPNTRKEVYLVVDFISYNDIKTELEKLKRHGTAKNETVQILWLISSFVLACKEVSVDAYITCLP